MGYDDNNPQHRKELTDYLTRPDTRSKEEQDKVIAVQEKAELNRMNGKRAGYGLPPVKAKAKSMEEIGHPCLTPRLMANGALHFRLLLRTIPDCSE